MPSDSKFQAHVATAITALVCGIALTFVRTGAPLSLKSIGYGLARGLGLWIIGAIAVAVSQPGSALRNGVFTVLAALALNLFSAMQR